MNMNLRTAIDRKIISFKQKLDISEDIIKGKNNLHFINIIIFV